MRSERLDSIAGPPRVGLPEADPNRRTCVEISLASDGASFTDPMFHSRGGRSSKFILCFIGGLEERASVFAEFGEGVEGAAPDDAALLERDEHRTEEREGEDQGAEGKEEGVPGGDVGVAA
jgi:hypothetical protein